MNEWCLVSLGDKMFLDFLPSALFNNNVLLVNEVRISAKLRFSPEGKGVIKMLLLEIYGLKMEYLSGLSLHALFF